MAYFPTFPSDLVQAQREWNRTYAALAQQPLRTAIVRRRLQLGLAGSVTFRQADALIELLPVLPLCGADGGRPRELATRRVLLQPLDLRLQRLQPLPEVFVLAH